MLGEPSFISLFLNGLGILFLIALPLVSILMYFLLRELRADSELDAAADSPFLRKVPSPKAHWRGRTEPDWRDPSAVDKLSAELVAIAFERVGVFAHSEKGDAILLFAAPGPAAAAWIQENAEGRLDLTVCSWMENGAPIRITTVKSETAFVLLPEERRHVCGACQPVQLCRKLVELRGGCLLQPVNSGNLVELMDREERARAHRFSGDAETAEIWEHYFRKSSDKSPETGQKIPGRALRNAFRHRLSDNIATCCLDAFSRESNMSAAEWARLQKRFVVIHDRLSPKKIGELEVFQTLTKEQQKKIKPAYREKKPAREVFEALNEELPPHARYQEVGRVSDPVDATVYLAS